MLQPHVIAPDALAIMGNQQAYSRQLGNNKKQAGTEINRMLDSALAWMVTRDPMMLTDARHSLILMSQWDPRGATGVNHHQVAGRMTWSMALGLDWLHDGIVARRAQADCRRAGGADGCADRRVRHPPAPQTGQDAVQLSRLGGDRRDRRRRRLLVGEDARADAWFEATVRPFIFLYSPWGGMDGGMGNGIAYGVWDAVALTIPLDILRMTVGVDMYRKGWNRNVGRFLTYFLPPGAQRRVR